MKRDFQPTVYMLANRRNGGLYIGVTSNLLVRIAQHRDGKIEGHAKEKGANMLVWYEIHESMESAITREKRMKKWYRQWKLNLIAKENPDWRDLAVDFGFPPAWTLPKAGA